jgi:predicted Zn-dependent peptidase
MKLIQEFKNEYNNITYRLYELDCGIKLIHLENPATVNFDFVAVHKAGSSYEDQEKVPHGTAHFLEHMLFNPNTTFKSIDEILQFEEGNLTRPALYPNGGTSRKFLYLQCTAQAKSTYRVLERIESLIEFPSNILDKYFPKEKNVVSAERSNQPKLENYSSIQLLQFIEGDFLPEFDYAVVGELTDIKKISLKNLEEYFRNRFVQENVIF